MPPELSPLDKAVIKEAFRRSATISWLAEHYQTTEDHIAEILGLPKNKEARDKLHRDHNFIDHGFGEERNTERKLIFYSTFLDCSYNDDEDDFTKFQPCCYMGHGDPKYHRLLHEAKSIPKTDNLKEEVRRHWILNRFTKYQSPEWEVHNDAIYGPDGLLKKLQWNYPPELRQYEAQEFRIK